MEAGAELVGGDIRFFEELGEEVELFVGEDFRGDVLAGDGFGAGRGSCAEAGIGCELSGGDGGAGAVVRVIAGVGDAHARRGIDEGDQRAARLALDGEGKDGADEDAEEEEEEGDAEEHHEAAPAGCDIARGRAVKPPGDEDEEGGGDADGEPWEGGPDVESHAGHRVGVFELEPEQFEEERHIWVWGLEDGGKGLG